MTCDCECCTCFSDDHGREVCGQYLGSAEECHSGDTEEKQQWTQLRGTLQKCLHNGATQTWGETLLGSPGGRK